MNTMISEYLQNGYKFIIIEKEVEKKVEEVVAKKPRSNNKKYYDKNKEKLQKMAREKYRLKHAGCREYKKAISEKEAIEIDTKNGIFKTIDED